MVLVIYLEIIENFWIFSIDGRSRDFSDEEAKKKTEKRRDSSFIHRTSEEYIKPIREDENK